MTGSGQMNHVSSPELEPSRLRVLYTEMARGFGGSAKSLAELIAVFADVDPFVLSPLGVKVFDSEGTTHFVIPKLALGPRPGTALVVRYWDDACSVLRWLLASVRFARKTRTHVIHTNNSLGSAVPSLIAGRLLGVPVVVHQRGFLVTSIRLRLALRLLGRSPVIAISHAVVRNLEEVGVPQERIVQIYDVVTFPSTIKRSDRDRTTTPLRVGMHSVLTPWKGHGLFLEAARLVQHRAPDLLHFVIAGSTLPGEEHYEMELRETVRACGLDSCVQFVGHVDDVYGYLTDIDISVHASILPEPLGRVIIEAQLARVCVVAANAGGASELIDGEAGFGYTPGNAEELAEALITLAKDPAKRLAYAERGRRKAEVTFGRRSLHEDVRQIYRQLTGR